MMFNNVFKGLQQKPKKKVKARVVLQKKTVMDVHDPSAHLLDGVHELLGKGISLQLVSAVYVDSQGLKGKVGKAAYLENWNLTFTPLIAGETAFKVTFDLEEDVGAPGAFLIKNYHQNEFYLKTLTFDDFPGQGRLHFVCNSWVYPTRKYKSDRIFFVNKAYLPGETPAPLIPYREEELANLRGNGSGKLEEWDRVYDYDLYNDLGDPDKGPEFARPVLGGSVEYPYPRRGRTGQPPTKTDPKSETRLPISQSVYVPRDEQFANLKFSNFTTSGLKAILRFLDPGSRSLFDRTPTEFNSFKDILRLFEGGIKIPEIPLLGMIKANVPLESLKELIRTDGEGYFRYPKPQVVQVDKDAWSTDEEFAREMLAGVNPVSIRRLEEFPPASKLDPTVYGNQQSTISEDHIKNNLDGLTVGEAIKNNRIFILDHHDALMPYMRRINTTASKVYATRTLLFLQNDGTLKPLAIELSLPHPEGNQNGAVSKVFTPAKHGVESSIWQLAKAYVAVNDFGIHQLISHWLNTHAVIEPFIIATNRQLSVLHPINKLLKPHFLDTMYINALARRGLVNGGGLMEYIVFSGNCSVEISSAVYKNWVFTEQGLPADLIKRGVAVKDTNAPHGLRLLIEDYPYAVDGLKIWSAIETWVREYCNISYKNDELVREDVEIQSWWRELREVGHGDKKDEPWWPKMQTLEDLINTCTTIIWVTSALHAAVNFGQFPYEGYLPNRPTMCRNFMPEPGSAEYEELKVNPEKVFLKTITPKAQAILCISLMEILSRHSSDEVYLGQRNTPEWTTNNEAVEALAKFGMKLGEIEKEIVTMNNDQKWKNRVGPGKVPYTLLHPSSEVGLTGKGIPNSISI